MVRFNHPMIVDSPQRIRIHYKIIVDGKFVNYDLKTETFEFEENDYIVSSWAVPKVFLRYLRKAIDEFGVNRIEVVSSYYGKHIPGSKQEDYKNRIIERLSVKEFFTRFGFEYYNFNNIKYLTNREKELFDFLFSGRPVNKALKYYKLDKEEFDDNIRRIECKLKFGSSCNCWEDKAA